MDNAIPMSIPSMPNPATLPNPSTPWMMSLGVFQRVQSISTNESYKKCELTSNDPEWAFVQSYFATQPPENRHIGRVYCIHNGASTRQFEALIPSLEEESKHAAFTPKWNQEKECALRQRVINRWKGATDFYSPIVLQGSNQRKDKYLNVKILPLWHGTTAAICDSVCKTGFTSFGKHALIQGSNTPDQNTDIGYFGSGIYFTNSARYAADIYSDGNLLLAWVSMREPYPVVANCEFPNKPKDMEKLEGLSHYENYNAHYIPVISVDPANTKCAVYYPCTVNQEATLDEIVVFHKTQALARFWIELEVTLAKSPFPSTETIGILLDKILEFLDHPEVQQNPGLTTLLETKSNVLFSINTTNPLDPENLAFYQKITRLMDTSGKIRPIVAKQLVATQTAISPRSLEHQPILVQALPPPIIQPTPLIPAIAFEAEKWNKYFGDVGVEPTLPPNTAISPPPLEHQPILVQALPPPIIQPTPLISAIAFGAEKWNKYFGDVGVEPTLPPNIENILNSPCIFWPSKKVRDTHLLFLVPETVNGEPLTLNAFLDLVQKPKEGNRTQYRCDDCIKDKLGNQSTSSHWVLMTNGVIPDSLMKLYEDQKKLVATYAQNSGQPYELPKALDATIGILVTYVQTGRKLYHKPSTYTRCQEKAGVDQYNQHPVSIGQFDDKGLVINNDWNKLHCYLGVAGSRNLSPNSIQSNKNPELQICLIV